MLDNTLILNRIYAAGQASGNQYNKKAIHEQMARNHSSFAFFGDKYGDRVRVVRAGSHSLEFCGGTHVQRLGDIGQIQVVSEASIGSGTRRIEAVSGNTSVRRSREIEAVLSAVAGTLKVSVDEVLPAPFRCAKQDGYRQSRPKMYRPAIQFTSSQCGVLTYLNG